MHLNYEIIIILAFGNNNFVFVQIHYMFNYSLPRLHLAKLKLIYIYEEKNNEYLYVK